MCFVVLFFCSLKVDVLLAMFDVMMIFVLNFLARLYVVRLIYVIFFSKAFSELLQLT